MRIPLWWWRMRYPGHFYQCQRGHWWLGEDFTEDKGVRKYILIAHSLYPHQPSARRYASISFDASYREFLLSHGTSYDPPTFQTTVELIENELIGKEKLCFTNSLEFGDVIQEVHPHLEVRYVEGMAINPTGAHLHGWLLINGKVVDLTWPDSFLCHYFGVSFSVMGAREVAQTIGKYGIFHNWNDEVEQLARQALAPY